jgi:hypothetical protein
MPIFEKIRKAKEDRDADAFIDLMADDYVFVRHQTGTEMNRGQTAERLKRMMAPGGTTFGKSRCIYENDDILVEHSINDYADGTRESVISVYSLLGGKIRRLETGVTPLG